MREIKEGKLIHVLRPRFDKQFLIYRHFLWLLSIFDVSHTIKAWINQSTRHDTNYLHTECNAMKSKPKPSKFQISTKQLWGWGAEKFNYRDSLEDIFACFVSICVVYNDSYTIWLKMTNNNDVDLFRLHYLAARLTL